MTLTHKMFIKEIPVPKGTIMVTLEQDFGKHVTTKEMFFTPEDFLEFFKPLVDYYEGVKNEQRSN